MPKTANRIKRLCEDAGYAEAQAKLAELKAKLNAAHGELSEMHSQATQQAKANPLDREAYRELGIDLPHESIGKSMTEVRDRIRVLQRAIELQTETLLREQSRAALATAREQLPAYRDVVQHMASVLTQLREVEKEESRFRDELFQTDALCTAVIRPMPFGHDTLGRIEAYLAEAREYYGVTSA